MFPSTETFDEQFDTEIAATIAKPTPGFFLSNDRCKSIKNAIRSRTKD